MKICYALVLLPVLLSAKISLAYNSVSAVREAGRSRLTTAIVLHDATYETSNDFDVEGNLLTFGYKTAINSKLAIGAGFGLMLDGEIGSGARIKDGEGYRIFLDADYRLARFDRNYLIGTFSLIRDSFEFGSQSSIEFDVLEIKFGALILRRIQNFSLYGGLELYAYSDGDMKAGRNKVEIDRSDRINARLGLSFSLDQSIDLRTELFLIGEQSVLLGADFRI